MIFAAAINAFAAAINVAAYWHTGDIMNMFCLAFSSGMAVAFAACAFAGWRW